MSLIEQFGGYREAKEWLDANEHEVKHGYLKDYKRELLQYRRENNIFDEKDKIVFVDDFMHGEIMIVAWVRDGEVWMDDGAKRCTDFSMIRHATPKEITQGYRDE